MSASRTFTLAAVTLLTAGCGLTSQPTVNTAELLRETQDVVGTLQSDLADFQGQIDSLRMELHRQDSLLRVLANLQGMQLPANPSSTIFPP